MARTGREPEAVRGSERLRFLPQSALDARHQKEIASAGRCTYVLLSNETINNRISLCFGPSALRVRKRGRESSEA
jgi:hypothetical protein